MPAPWKKSYDQPRQHIKKQRYYFANKGLSSQSYGFSSSHVYMWEVDYNESWEPKNWCFSTAVLEKTLENPLDCKEIKPVHPKGNQSWMFIGRTDAEAETPILWPLDAKDWFIGKDPDTGKIEGRRRGWRGWDGWMTSLTQWTWVWASSGNWWWAGKTGVLQSMGLQRVEHDWVTKLLIQGEIIKIKLLSISHFKNNIKAKVKILTEKIQNFRNSEITRWWQRRCQSSPPHTDTQNVQLHTEQFILKETQKLS